MDIVSGLTDLNCNLHKMAPKYPELDIEVPSSPIGSSPMKMNGAGCIFEHFGRIPETIYTPTEFESPIEKAVHDNDLKQIQTLIEEGERVGVRLKIGEMSCIEYAAMKGYVDILSTLLDSSSNASTLRQYFQTEDVVDRAYMISRNKDIFFGREALAEANRYEAALFTAVEYNQPECVALLLKYLGKREPSKHNFKAIDSNEYQNLSATELARERGFSECYKILFTQNQ